ncbi:MAG: hypothetical protein AABY93_10370 [Bacteroidota bacterium]
MKKTAGFLQLKIKATIHEDFCSSCSLVHLAGYLLAIGSADVIPISFGLATSTPL